MHGEERIPGGQGVGVSGSVGNDGGNQGASTCARVATRLCTGANPDISAADLTICRSLKGFYVADVIGNRLGAAPPTCGAGINTHVVYGCGEAVSRATDFLRQQCGFFGQAMDCGNNLTGVKCGAVLITNIEQLQNAASTDGVLCCPL